MAEKMEFKSGLPRKFTENKISLLLLLLCLGVMMGCAEITNTPTPIWHDVDPLFRRIYEYMGGEDILGPVISRSFQEGYTTVQFTMNAKMVFDPSKSDKNRFRLAPLGRTFELIEPEIHNPDEPDSRYVCGHTIAAEFIQRYEKLGEWVVGCPLTELRFNPDSNRYEQFFENLGFYRSVLTGEIGQLAYGEMACDTLCRQSLISAIIDSGSIGIVHVRGTAHPVFQDALVKLGTDFTGFVLSEAYINSEGHFEQIFENVVLTAAVVNDSRSVGVKALLLYLHWPMEEAKPASVETLDLFIQTDGELGFEVPQEIWEYIENHGGMPATGMPISNLRQVKPGDFFQCFQNACLKYNPTLNKPLRVRPEPLGYVYRKIYRPERQSEATLATGTPRRQITMRAWERNPTIRSSEQQEVGVRITENSLGLVNRQPIIKIYLPGGEQHIFSFPPTNEDGISNLVLPQIPAANGSLITYEVCLSTETGGSFCVSDGFVIWDNP